MQQKLALFDLRKLPALGLLNIAALPRSHD